MEVTISATYLAEHLSGALDQVQERGDWFVIHHNGETIARIEPVPKKPGITARDLLSDEVAQVGRGASAILVLGATAQRRRRL
jgi:antitoxin (DNA-binding transcriptional repressor) of toxin-antitoxin stability system